MIEQDVRYQIDRSLEANGWILDAHDTRQNVFFENAVKSRLPQLNLKKLGQKKPDYTLFDGVQPIAVIEAKKSNIVNLDDALNQASDYAECMDVDIVFACNGLSLKSRHLKKSEPLFFNGVELNELPSLDLLRKYYIDKTNEVFTVSKEVIKSRDELISLFSELNEDFRAVGIRAGIERFSEFANILFLKLLSEKGEDDIWDTLMRLPENDIVQYLNSVIVNRLKESYGGEVISPVTTDSTAIIKKIVQKLNPLNLTDIDEDIKGSAFEYFMEKTTTATNDLGEYFTPRHIVKFMVRLLNPKFGETVFDPFCGTGGFLTEAFKHISQQAKLSRMTSEKLQNKTVFGSEITTTARIAKMNMILFGDGHSGVSQRDSLLTNTTGEYNNVLSNIPFSLDLSTDILDRSKGHSAKDADEACVLKCFNSLKVGGSMAIVVPEGLLVNKVHRKLLRFILGNSCVRMLVRLPRGCFAPYTDAKTGIIYLTDKGVGQTDWFYRVTVDNDGFDSKRNPKIGINDLDNVLFFHTPSDIPVENLPEGLEIGIVQVKNVQSDRGFSLHEDWKVGDHMDYVNLEDVAFLKNGTSITEATTTEGNIPVIAGGRGTVPYTHGESNYPGNVFTVSKSGAYSGYVWWHNDPIWASDSIVVQSKDESKYLTRYLYMCLKSMQDPLYRRQQGTGQPHIYIEHIRDFPIPVISIDEQKAKIKPIEDIDAKLRAVKAELSVRESDVNEFIKSCYE
ncbi:hypothetical protein C6501_16140 [Candidatus Poribacteria bacterium]|nr:MAG: hypothetical protein C6501_16140 [Candidatus Poribacteria bacterium]